MEHGQEGAEREREILYTQPVYRRRFLPPVRNDSVEKDKEQ